MKTFLIDFEKHLIVKINIWLKEKKQHYCGAAHSALHKGQKFHSVTFIDQKLNIGQAEMSK